MSQPSSRHLEDTDLMEYIDGELPGPASDRAGLHLGSCQTCRTRLDLMQDGIKDFLRTRRVVSPDELVPPGLAELRFREKLTEHRGSQSRGAARVAKLVEWRSLLAEFSLYLPQYWKLALALLVAGLALALVLTVPFDKNVSADTILSRASAYESLHMRVPDKVVRSSVQISRIDLSTSKERQIREIEIAQDCKTLAVHVTTHAESDGTRSQTLQSRQDVLNAFPLTSEFEQQLTQYFTTRRWFPDVSISAYVNLIAGRGDNRSFAVKRGDLFELHHFFAQGHPSNISETLLLLDASSYTPLRISIFAFDGDRRCEYRLTRTLLEFVDRSEEVAKLFERPKAAVASGTSRKVLPNPTEANATPDGDVMPSPRPLPLSYFNSKASDVEVAAALALHRADACLGEEINVFQMSDGLVLVQGLVEGQRRKEAITKALSALKDLPLRVEIYTPPEVGKGVELYAPPDRAAEKLASQSRDKVVAGPSSISGERMLLYDQLSNHFSKRLNSAGAPPTQQEIDRQVAAFANEVIKESSRELFHAWALKKLDVQFSQSRASGLSPLALNQVEEIRSDHRRSISRISRRLITMLSEIAPDSAGLSRRQATALDSESLLRIVAEQNDLIRSLFTLSSQVEDPAKALARLLVLMQRVN